MSALDKALEAAKVMIPLSDVLAIIEERDRLKLQLAEMAEAKRASDSQWLMRIYAVGKTLEAARSHIRSGRELVERVVPDDAIGKVGHLYNTEVFLSRPSGWRMTL